MIFFVIYHFLTYTLEVAFAMHNNIKSCPRFNGVILLSIFEVKDHLLIFQDILVHTDTYQQNKHLLESSQLSFGSPKYSNFTKGFKHPLLSILALKGSTYCRQMLKLQSQIFILSKILIPLLIISDVTKGAFANKDYIF